MIHSFVHSFNMNTTATDNTNSDHNSNWVRGVNLGGWLVMERFITPYQFAITDCHVRGDLCWYADALSISRNDTTNAPLCSNENCQPFVRYIPQLNVTDYPVDEWTLSEAFDAPEIAEEWFNTHFEHFIQKEHLIKVKAAGITHVRVPLPHWILGNIVSNEPWIAGDRWKYLERLLEWCRELQLEVWPNLHTAPGSQNGFDNSGVLNQVYTCGGWTHHPQNIQRTLDVLDQIATALIPHSDVVTGFGLLNEPFGDCNMEEYRLFLNDGLKIVRKSLPEATIFVSDRFASKKFNDGFWSDTPNVVLDTHFYQAFDPYTRALSPQQHVALTCHSQDPQGNMDTCCDPDANGHALQRISTEWSAAFDCMPGELLQAVMARIHHQGIALGMHRQLEPARQDFMKDYVKAQMASYEASSKGWFFWTIRMEGGAFAEWDFLRGVDEGWMPVLPNQTTTSITSLYGTCTDILEGVTNDSSIVHPYPYGDEAYWLESTTRVSKTRRGSKFGSGGHLVWMILAMAWLVTLVRSLRRRRRRSHPYTPIPNGNATK